MCIFLIDKLHWQAYQCHCGGRIPEGNTVTAAYAKFVLQEPEDRRDTGAE